MVQIKKKKKKRTWQIVDSVITAGHRVKLKFREKRYKHLDLARELKKSMENGGDGDTNSNWCIQNHFQ